MSKAIRFDEHGGVDVLEVREVERPTPGDGQVLIRVKAAGINPGESAIREGVFADRWPTTFPSGQGSDLAGVVEELGAGVDAVAVGDEVLGWTDERASHAELVVVPADQVAAKPEAVSWEVAGSLFVAGMAALGSVRAVAPQDGEVVVVSAGAGGVGSIATQLARRTGATVIGLASERNHEWLRSHGVVPVAHGDGVEDRIREAAGGRVDGFVDLFGNGYVELALGLGVAKERINTIFDFEAAAAHGITTQGTSETASAEALAEVAELVASGAVEVPIAATYPLERVAEAYTRLADRTTHGKIVLVP
ncbi:NADP-dependent oxidoreductase [Patulibacter minatonensis]|uniref:NADP-dependent oxidoreductase n=1 Tax=Patulibacter minatonensis TaxID=298163 RepID=UPI000479963A|nr:NADP-dependent oxidoreductase [Patulibacter minatonensis]